MSSFLEFQTTEQHHILVEVDEQWPENGAGIAKAGLRDATGRVISVAQELFNDAIARAMKTNVEAFRLAISALPVKPTDVEISFGLKATGEIGNIAISKMGAEGNFSIKLTWKDFGKEENEMGSGKVDSKNTG